MALMTWPAPNELEPYPWATVPCPACGEAELASKILGPITDFVCMACGTITQICRTCLNSGMVCEEHDDPLCDSCGVGTPCPSCCDPIPTDGTHSIMECFIPRHLLGDPLR